MLMKLPFLNFSHYILRHSGTIRHTCVDIGRAQFLNKLNIPHEPQYINNQQLVFLKRPLSSKPASKFTVKNNSPKKKKGKYSIFDNPKQSTIIGEDAAVALMKAVKSDLSETDQLVEINPGPGLLTDMLLTQTSNRMLVFEPRENFNSELNIKYKKYIDEKRLIVSHFDFLKFYTYYVYHIKSGDPKFTEFIELFPDQEDPYSSNIKIVGSISDPSFFSRIILSTIFGVTVYGKFLPTLYILLSSRNYNRFYSDILYIKNSFLKSSIQSKIFFDVEKLGSVKPNNVYPSIDRRTQVAKRKLEHDLEWNIAKLEPNFNLLNMMSTSEKVMLMHFLRVISKSPSRKHFCDQIEKYIDMISSDSNLVGLNPSMKVKEVSLQQILVAFKGFMSHIECEKSLFKSEADYLVKVLKGLKADH